MGRKEIVIMCDGEMSRKRVLGLRAGDDVEVRSREEILSTLDDRGCLEGLPFMPEMLQHCGKKFRVFKSAHKTCDTIKDWKTMRRMTMAVHLDGVRCDGKAHDGCQAGCLLFWKEAWLKPVGNPVLSEVNSRADSERAFSVEDQTSDRDVETLTRATRISAERGNPQEDRYFCQATELLRATTPLPWWDWRQYVKDLSSGNVHLFKFIIYLIIALFNFFMRLHWRGRPYPYIHGLAGEKTPTAILNLKSGELVQVRSKKEIMQSLSAGQKNRGLWFDVEMTPYCGRRFRVLRQVEKIIDDKTGRMISLPNTCLILDDVTCGGCLSQNRLFCPRHIYQYWHEIWLKRVE